MSKKIRRLAAGTVVAAAAWLPLAQASTSVIDFDDATLTGLYFPGESLIQAGYTLTAVQDFGIVDVAAALGPVAPTGNSTQFYFNSNSGSLRVTRADGLPFTLDSFSAAFVPLDPPSDVSTVMVALGTPANGSPFLFDWAFATGPGGSNPFSTMAPAVGLLFQQLDFRACALVNSSADCSVPLLNNGQFAIDDIVLTAVPEPASTLLLTLGLAGLAARARQARRPRHVLA